MGNVYLLRPPGAYERKRQAQKKAQRNDQLARAASLELDVRSSRAEWERALYNASQCDEWLDEKAKRGWLQKASLAKGAMARAAFELAVCLSEYMNSSMGTWRPDSSQVGTTLEDWQLDLIAQVAGLGSSVSWQPEHTGAHAIDDLLKRPGGFK